MKSLRNILTVLILSLSFQLFGQANPTDTTYIFKDTIDGEIQAIFIDNNRDSEFYEKISHFNFQYYDDESYKYSIQYLNENNLTLSKVKPIIPWTNWVRLQQYQGEFCAYHPCDFYFHFRQSINDTTFIDWTGEGPIANKIINQKKNGNDVYQFNLTGINDHDRTITVHIIDIEKGIAVFEQTKDDQDRRYYLMIAADKISGVPIIVNVCPAQKQSELRFDSTELESLLTPE